jgi:hypothetical protein
MNTSIALISIVAALAVLGIVVVTVAVTIHYNIKHMQLDAKTVHICSSSQGEIASTRRREITK